jgi:hypothetical protein
MEARDIRLYRLETEARQDALRRSMDRKREDDQGARRRVGGALVALGLLVGGEPPVAANGLRRYA